MSIFRRKGNAEINERYVYERSCSYSAVPCGVPSIKTSKSDRNRRTEEHVAKKKKRRRLILIEVKCTRNKGLECLNAIMRVGAVLSPVLEVFTIAI